jgi:hypothetical protein
MTWNLSRYRVGDLVEVRGKEEILATLDQHGCIKGLPFMPEMLQFCGQRFRVSAIAHKTCDTVRKTWKARRLEATVHLAGLRCDGTAHGGCEAECNLFWKDEWLKPVQPARETSHGSTLPSRANPSAGGCTEAALLTNTHRSLVAEGEEVHYFCQATQMFEATQQLAWWDVRQYVFDVVTGNRSVAQVSRVLFLASLRWLLPRVWCGYRLFKGFHDGMHHWLTGRGSPSLHGQIPEGGATPVGRLELNPGEYVRIKTQSEIEQTINKKGKNRGLSFDPEEMAPYCGGVYKVRSRVSKLIDETTGRMLDMKEPCIMLDGVVCKAEYASCRLNCPRAIPSYWREVWLERVDNGNQSKTEIDSLKEQSGHNP